MTTQEPQNGNNGSGSSVLATGPEQRFEGLKSYLAKCIPVLEKTIAAKYLNPERLVKLLTTATQRIPDLLDCSHQSILASLIDCSALGLEPCTPLGYAYILPFRNQKTKCQEAQPIIGWRGYVQLAHRSGDVARLYADVIHERDFYDDQRGSDKRLIHRPFRGPPSARGPIIAFYAAVKFTNGGDDYALLYKEEVDEIRAKAPGGDSPAWKEYFQQMGEKTAMRQLCKRIPMSAERELARAVAIEDGAEWGAPSDHSVVDLLPRGDDGSGTQEYAAAAPPPKVARGDALADQIKNKTGAA